MKMMCSLLFFCGRYFVTLCHIIFISHVFNLIDFFSLSLSDCEPICFIRQFLLIKFALHRLVCICVVSFLFFYLHLVFSFSEG